MWRTYAEELTYLGIGGFFAHIVFNVAFNSGTSTSPSAPARSAAKPVPTIDKSPAKQAERKKLIEKLIAQGLIQKVNTVDGNLPKMFIRPAFYNLDLDTKQTFASVVYAYYFDGSNFTDTVVLRDSRTVRTSGNSIRTWWSKDGVAGGGRATSLPRTMLKALVK